MAKQRYINTKFWSDSYISDLDPIEKLLFLYFLTNERTNVCGMYELPLKHMSVETGIEKEMIEKIIKRFSKEKKVFYIDGWIRVVNFTKHQATDNEKIKKGIEVAESLVPAQIKQKLYDMDSLSIPYVRTSNNSNLNSNLNSNSNHNGETSFSQDGAKIMELFIAINPSLKYGNKTQRRACDEMIAKFGLDSALGMVKKVLSVQGKQYAPTATTPYVMWQKIADFAVYFNKKDKSVSIDL